MATKIWRGDSPAIAQVDILTIGGTLEVGDLLIATINGKAFSHSATSTTLATAATAFAAAWNALSASAYPEFAEITAAATSGGALTLTADTAGKPFTVTASTTESNGGAADSQTFARTASVANSGPNCADVTTNWSGGTPVDGDDVVIGAGSSSILYGLDLSSVTPASISISQGFTGKIGLPEVNKDLATSPYYEYRETYLKFGNSGDATNIAVSIGSGDGSGSQRLKLDTGSSQATINVLNSGSPESTGAKAIYWKGTHASNSLTVSKGSIGVAALAGESATLLTLNVGYKTNVAGDCDVLLGSGVTLTDATIKQSGGSLTTNSATSGTATITQTDGKLTLNSGGQVGLSVLGGECIYNSTGTLGGAPVVSGNGHLNFSQDLRSKAVTNAVEVYGPNARVSDPFKTVATLVLDLNQTANSANLSIGSNLRITRGAVA